MRWAPLSVVALTAIGFLLRLAQFDQSLLADELSTYWIIRDNSLGAVLSDIHSDYEITPPLYFALAWLSDQIGSGPEWVRLPSLIAATATIPLLYMVGARTVGRTAALLATAIFALSPFMIYYAGEARSYALMVALLTASTLALLIALESGRRRWWVLHAVCAAGAMLSHYTAAFPLAAQFAWAVWAHREALRPLIAANLGAVVLFSPWIPGLIADSGSPTTGILSVLQPFEPGKVREALESWTVGYPYEGLGTVPGAVAGTLIVAGFAIATVAGSVRIIGGARRSRSPARAWEGRLPAGVVLAIALALAAPVGEAVWSLLGDNLFGARNLSASAPGLHLSAGALLAAAGPLAAAVCGALVVAGFALAAEKTLDSGLDRPGYEQAAEAIENRAAPGDVIVDTATFTPVPLTGLDVYLPPGHPEYRLGMFVSDEPFRVGDVVPDPARMGARAIRAARGGQIFLVAYLPDDYLAGATPLLADLIDQRRRLAAEFLDRLPRRFEPAGRVRIEGLNPLVVYRFADRNSSR